MRRPGDADLNFDVSGTQTGDGVSIDMSGTPSSLGFTGEVRGISLRGKLRGAAFGFLGFPSDSIYFTQRD